MMAHRAHGKGKSSNINGSSPSRITRLVKSAFTLYLLCAVVYTAYSFLLKPAISVVLGTSTAPDLSAQDALALSQNISDIQSIHHVNADEALSMAARIREDSGEALWSKKGHRGVGHAKPPPAAQIGVEKTNWMINKLNWHAPSDALAHAPAQAPDPAVAAQLDKKATPMAEDFFLSKVFGETLQPSKVIPYYYKASADHAQEDITITTLVTSNRFKVFAALVERYQGP